MFIAIITILAIECIHAAPFFDFLPPVIIDDNHRIATNHNAHTTIFFPVLQMYTTKSLGSQFIFNQLRNAYNQLEKSFTTLST